MAEALRIQPLNDRLYARSGVILRPCPAAERINLRAGADAVAAIGAAIDLELPSRPKTSATRKGLSALWLGPDEWLLIGEENGGLAERLASLSGHAFSAVDVSHRNTAFTLEGAGAAAVLSAGCPQDLSPAAFPAGACSRTLLAKAEIVLWRENKARFRVECWRSFSDYVWNYCVDSAKSV